MTLVSELPDTEAVVPDLSGLEFHDAKFVALQSDLFLVFADPDHPPLVMCFVVKQEPTPGAFVARRSAVTVWVEDAAGGVGVPEPRRPSPSHGDDPMALVEERSVAE
jgi:hypothetical protein